MNFTLAGGRCGQTTHVLPGTLQRLHRLPSDTRMCDLRYRLRCTKCNSQARFTVTVKDTSGRPTSLLEPARTVGIPRILARR
jgi:hypothetical protein